MTHRGKCRFRGFHDVIEHPSFNKSVIFGLQDSRAGVCAENRSTNKFRNTSVQFLRQQQTFFASCMAEDVAIQGCDIIQVNSAPRLVEI